MAKSKDKCAKSFWQASWSVSDTWKQICMLHQWLCRSICMFIRFDDVCLHELWGKWVRMKKSVEEAKGRENYCRTIPMWMNVASCDDDPKNPINELERYPPTRSALSQWCEKMHAYNKQNQKYANRWKAQFGNIIFTDDWIWINNWNVNCALKRQFEFGLKTIGQQVESAVMLCTKRNRYFRWMSEHTIDAIEQLSCRTTTERTEKVMLGMNDRKCWPSRTKSP